MEINWSTIGIFIVVWAIGYLLGLLEASMKNEKKEKNKDEITLDDDEVSEGGETIRTSDEDLMEPEVLTIFERISGALKIRLDGEIIEYKSDLSAEQHTRLMNLVISLRPWLDPAQTAKPLAPLPANAKIPTTPPDREFKTVDTSEVAEEVAFAKLSMVEQIDRILQKKIEGSALENRGIKMRTALSGGLLMQIGLEEYEWIDEIPEQEIQDIIRESIAEWEESAT